MFSICVPLCHLWIILFLYERFASPEADRLRDRDDLGHGADANVAAGEALGLRRDEDEPRSMAGEDLVGLFQRPGYGIGALAAIATVVAIVASAFRGKRYLDGTEPLSDELADGAAEIGGITGFVEPVASSDADLPANGNGHGHLATAEQSGGIGADRGTDSPGSS